MKKAYYPKTIPMPKGRRIVVGDIHGCFESLKDLLEDIIKIVPEDQIFFLGDYINKGASSAMVLDYLLFLSNNSFEIIPLRGNHEKMFLMAYDCGFDFFENFLEKYNSTDLLNENIYEYLEWCSKLDYCVFTKDFFLSHSGITNGVLNSFADIRVMFSEVDIKIDTSSIEKMTSIHGHFTKTKTEIEKSVLERSKIISLDGGCVEIENEDLGYLCALNIDDNQLFFVKILNSIKS